LSHEILEVAGAEAVATAEGNMCGAVMRGTVALPGSEATSRMNGSRRNLGDLTPPAVATAIPGHDRKSRRRSCWGRREESDGCVVPMKPRTKPTTNRQRREWREGGRSKERRAATHAPDSEPGRRVTEAASLRVGGTWAAKLLPSIAFDLRREPTAGKLHGGIWCSEASCHSSGCKSRQHKESSPCCSDTQRQGG
jgi:hypothetical protein